MEVQATTMPTTVPKIITKVQMGNTSPMLYRPTAQRDAHRVDEGGLVVGGVGVWVRYIPLVMSVMKTGAVTQCSTLSHLFQLWSSSSLSITGTVSDRRMLAGLCAYECV